MINNKILKEEELIKNNRKEENKVLFPFKKRDSQRVWSIMFIILGLLILIIKSLANFINSLGLNSFIVGLLMAVMGFFYFMDIQ